MVKFIGKAGAIMAGRPHFWERQYRHTHPVLAQG